MNNLLDHEPLRPDGGTGEVLDPPPLDAVDEDALRPEALAENAPQLETVIQLLNRPALARVYTYVCYWGSVTPPEIMNALGFSKSTIYEYIDTLTGFGLVDRDDSTRPQRLTADPLVVFEQYAQSSSRRPCSMLSPFKRSTTMSRTSSSATALANS